jgi:phenylacetate-coenzyme A ligase PaaK-like adenylate-forming protein
MKPLVEISIEHYERLLKYASETSPAYTRLKNAVKTEANTIAILCDLDEAEMLREVAKHFCPDAVSQIEKAIRLAHFPD